MVYTCRMDFLDFSLATPLMNAAGTLGFAPDPHGPVGLTLFGAFVTNPISLEPRPPARGTRLIPFPGGVLLHSGLPNPGLRRGIEQYAAAWARAPLPVIPHLLGESPREAGAIAAQLEELEGVAALELGLPPRLTAGEAAAFVAAAVGKQPLIVRLPVDQAGALAGAVVRAGAAALSLGPPRGALWDVHGVRVEGRLYGPGVFPLGAAALLGVRDFGVPVIAGGGVFRQEQVSHLLEAGAAAVQLDVALWRGEWFGQALPG